MLKMLRDNDDKTAQGRFYYVYFSISDDCGNSQIVRKTLWVPFTEDSYIEAKRAGKCPHGAGTDIFRPNLPRST